MLIKAASRAKSLCHAIIGMAALSIILASQAAGQLKISPENPRYFADGNRNAILMTGSHTWSNRQDVTLENENHLLDFTAYLSWMKRYNHNFIRMWVWEQSKWHPHMECGFLFQPTIYMRTGPGTALDGRPKFDVTKFNPEFFDRLRSRVIEAGKNGIYVSVMLFEGWSIEEKYQKKENPWNGHPFHRDNNINGIDGDINGDGQGLEVHTLLDDQEIQVIRKYQEEYVRKVIDAVNDLNNVMYEISNESHGNSVQWQYHMINFIKNYEASSKQKRHLVWMTSEGGSNVITNEMLFKSPADVISPNSRGGYIDDPPADTRNKIVISDTDHLWGVGGVQEWVWKSFTRGLHPIFMDPYDAYYWNGFAKGQPPFDLKYEPVRRSMGYVRQYSERMDLVHAKPSNELASTTFCLAIPGSEYLIYQPLSLSEFTVNIAPGEYKFEWFHPSSGKTIDSGARTLKAAIASFKASISGDVVLYLKAAGKDQQGSARIREKFDFGWMFHKGDIPIKYYIEERSWEGITDCMYRGKPSNIYLDPEEWKSIDIPHDWCMEGAYVYDDSIGARPAHSGYLLTGIGCYRKEFTIPESDKGKKIWFEFDGVLRNSTVWVNGFRMGNHLSGYTSFYYDVSDVVRYGDEGKNVIFVKVDARQGEGYWYEGAGMYRHVWLVKMNPLHVAHWGTYVTTPEIAEEYARVDISTIVKNEYAEGKRCRLVSKIIDEDNKLVESLSSDGEISAWAESEFEQMCHIKNPQLWSPEHPYLYKALTEVHHGGTVVDTYETTFGIRSLKFTADKGFFLNGKHTFIKGTCNHQDFAGVGIASPDALIEYKIQILKDIGCNAYRCAHYPPTPALLDVCDRLGMMVMDENRNLDSSPEGVECVESMLYRDRNHPSIILWSMENEERLEGTEMGARILKTLVETVHKIEPTRPVLAAMNHGWNSGGYSDVLDIVGYNYGHRNSQDVNDHKQYPNRIIIGSESASTVSTRGIYEKDEKKGYLPAYPETYPNWGCTPERAWGDVVNNPFLTGIFIWSGFNYRGEQTPFKWPCIGSHFGIVDVCGFPKDISYYYKSVWTDEPMVHIFPHWNWQGKEGKEIEVWAYSNCETVELFLNGKSLGEKGMIPASHLVWTVRYAPGELKAIARTNGKEAARKIIETANEPARVLLSPNRVSIAADGCDCAVVRVSVLDDKDRLMPTADNEVMFSIEGPGKILGVGNGDPSSHEPDKSNKRKAFNGFCMVIVQAAKEAGEITLTAESPGLNAGRIVISVR